MPIILIRHGEAENNVNPEIGSWHNPSLTETGRKQATALGLRLEKSLRDTDCTLYTSHKKRAVETAEILSRYLSVTPIGETELEEYRHGLDPETSMSEARTYWGEPCTPVKHWRPYRTGESVEEIFERASKVIEKINGPDDKLVLVVSHSWLIDKMISYWIGFKIDYLPPSIFQTTNSSITVLSHNRHGDRVLERMNDTSHLDDDLFKNG
jgi:broad specificity phosphatase PhoE